MEENTNESKFISIEIIREKLKNWTYKNIEEFDADMKLMFSAWLKTNSKEHKYYKTYQAIADRFNKQIKRAKERIKEAMLKSEAKGSGKALKE